MLSSEDEQDLKIFDCNLGKEALVSYHETHIPGAGIIDLNLFSDRDSPYSYMLPKKQEFVDHMKYLGVKKSTRVVVYDKENSYFATRVYWMLRTYGHKKVSFLNGGFKKWLAEKRPVEST
jgi:thiosulfate/3-mercaptopyruvate sulfurtransferase